MPDLTITAHAVLRYQQRVTPCTPDEAREALSSLAVHQAAMFGAPYVRLATGQRIVLDGSVVVTVLPIGQRVSQVAWFGYGERP